MSDAYIVKYKYTDENGYEKRGEQKITVAGKGKHEEVSAIFYSKYPDAVILSVNYC